MRASSFGRRNQLPIIFSEKYFGELQSSIGSKNLQLLGEGQETEDDFDFKYSY